MRFWFAFALNLLKQNYELRGVSSLKKMAPETRNEFMLQCFHLIQVSKNSNPVWLENSAVSARLMKMLKIMNLKLHLLQEDALIRV